MVCRNPNGRHRSISVPVNGDVFGNWTVTSLQVPVKGLVKVTCLCVCGTEKAVNIYDLIKGKSVSCGCLGSKARIREIAKTHGLSRTKEHRIWCGIVTRCCNSNHHTFQKYGARGIEICERWRNSFEAFLKDVGPCPSPQHSIDRIDNNGNYEPENVRWATRREQNNNKRNNRFIEFQGETQSVGEWSKRMGISRNVITSRMWNGWTAERALTTPVRKIRKSDRGATAHIQVARASLGRVE